jgi:hypothetical protein
MAIAMHDTAQIAHSEVVQALTYLVEPGGLFEIRAFNVPTGPSRKTWIGYFHDPVIATDAITRIPSLAHATICVTLNPILDECRYRADGAYNKLRPANNGEAVSDKDVTRRSWLLIDCDPERMANTSASDEQHTAAIDRMLDVTMYLRDRGWPEPLMADSGNGAHALYPIDLPNDDHSKKLIERVLQALAFRFNDEQVKIDTSVFNAARICKIPGTWARKGANVPERPHRRSAIISLPGPNHTVIECVPLDHLEAIASLAPTKDKGEERTTSPKYQGKEFHLEQWLVDHAIGYTLHEDTDKEVFRLDACPFNPEHTSPDAAVFRFPDGRLGFLCFHNSCQGKTWREFREHYEPGCYAPKTKRSRTSQQEGEGSPRSRWVATERTTSETGRKPIIVTNEHLGDLARTVQTYLTEANTPPKLFWHGGRLARVREPEETGKPPTIEDLSHAAMRSRICEVCEFYKIDAKGNEIACHPATELIETLMILDTWKIPVIERITTIPILRPDGSIVETTGYDEVTKSYYYPLRPIPAIPANPTRDEMHESITLIRDILGEFPYADEASFANAIALALTPILRLSLDSVPLALISANKQGTGKSFLTNVLMYMSMGRWPATTNAPTTEEEWGKKLTSMISGGDPVIVFDNVKIKLESSALENALTSQNWTDRILGQSRTGSWPQRATWIANGNNLTTGDETIRRCYMISLMANDARPWENRTFKYDLKTWLPEHFGEVVRALLIIIRAWYQAGKPITLGRRIGGFEQWSTTLGSILAFAGITGFLANQDALYDKADTDTPQWENFLTVWYERWGDKPITVRDLVDAIDAERSNRDRNTPLTDNLPDAIVRIRDEEEGQQQRRRIGRVLGKKENTPYGTAGLRLTKLGRASDGDRWQVTMKSVVVYSVYSFPLNAGKNFTTTEHDDADKNVVGWQGENNTQNTLIHEDARSPIPEEIADSDDMVFLTTPHLDTDPYADNLGDAPIVEPDSDLLDALSFVDIDIPTATRPYVAAMASPSATVVSERVAPKPPVQMPNVAEDDPKEIAQMKIDTAMEQNEIHTYAWWQERYQEIGLSYFDAIAATNRVPKHLIKSITDRQG